MQSTTSEQSTWPAGGKAFWKIDYYADPSMDADSKDPADSVQCFRVLTLMLASEY